MLVTMSEEEWDDVVAVHLKGHFVPTRFAAAYWREQVEGRATTVQASIIHTSSTSGLLGNPGQTNYGAAKAGIGSFSIICAQELARYGVRSNCIAPAARTRLTEATPGLGEMVAAPDRRASTCGTRPTCRRWSPTSPPPTATITGRTFFVQGGTVRVMEPWRMGERLERADRWTIDDLGRGAARDPVLSALDAGVERRGGAEGGCTIGREPCPARWGGVLDVAFPSRRDEAAAPAGRARSRPGSGCGT